MATGDITNLAVSANGKQLTLRAEGLTAASVTAFQTGKSAMVACTSDSFSGTTPSATPRTGLRTEFVSAVDNLGNSDITLNIEEPIHPGDTVTIDIDAGAFSDGTNSSAAVADGAVTNNSTLDYAEPVCNIVSEVLTKHTDAFYVDVYACAAPYKGSQSNFGIAAVQVIATDKMTVSSPSGDFTNGETITGGTSGVTATVIAHDTTDVWVKNVSGAWTAGETLTGGTSTFTATYSAGGLAVTKAATALSLIDRIGEYGAYEQWQAFHVGPFDPDDAGDWGANGASQGLAHIVAKAYPQIGDADSVSLSADEYLFLDKANNYPVRHAVVDPTSGNDTTGLIGTGDGGYSLGTDGVSATAKANPYATMHAAISDCQRGDGTTAAPSHGRASWSVVYLVEDSHAIGTYSFGTRSDTRDGPIIITRLPGTAKANVKITGSVNSDGIRTLVSKYDDVVFAMGASGSLRAGEAGEGTAGPIAATETYILKNAEWYGAAQDSSSATPTNGFGGTYIYGGYVHDLTATPSGGTTRDVLYKDFSGDPNGGGTNKSIINNKYDGPNPLATGNHLDIIQIASGSTNENIAMHCLLVVNQEETQSPFFVNAETATTLHRFSMTFCISEADDDATIGQIDDLVMTSCFWYHNSFAETLLMRADLDAFSAENVWFMRNVYRITESGSPDLSGIFAIDNHDVNTDNPLGGFDATTGETTTALWSGPTAGNFNPKSATIKNRWSDPIAPYDAAGNTMPTDGTGAIGALQFVAGLAGGGRARNSRDRTRRGRLTWNNS